jgi:hypothetical protein
VETVPKYGSRPNTGRYASEEEALAAVVARLVEELDPQAIWLFGSRARGDHRPDSDFDLLVVAKEGQAWGEDYRRVYRATRGTGIGCDVIPCTAEDFAIGQLLPTTLVSQVLAHGCELFEAKAHRGFSGTRSPGPSPRKADFAGQSGGSSLSHPAVERKAAASGART